MDKGTCPLCAKKLKYLSADLRPVFPEERLLLELLLGEKAFTYVEKSVWAANSRYYINGKSVSISRKMFQETDTDTLSQKLEQYRGQNTYTYFNKYISDFGLCTFLDPEEHREITNPNEKVGPAFWMSPEAIDCSYFENDLIGTHSDVFQLCAVFAFVLTKRFPGGIIQDSNSLNTTPEIRDVLVRSLSNDYSQRPVDGSALVVQYNNATYART